MKKLVIMLLLVSCGILFAQESRQPSVIKTKNDFDALTFRVSMDEKSYHPLETAFVTFMLSNETESDLSMIKPEFEKESKLKVITAEKTEIYSIPYASDSIPVRFPVNLQNGDSYEKTVSLDILRNEMFPLPGVYEIQFILSSADRGHSLESNKINIVIVKPEGIDKDAYDVLLKYSKYIGTFSWAYVIADGDKQLEIFAREYGATVYGEWAIYNLGMLYKSKNENEKAEIQFRKIRSSKNKHISKIASQSLDDAQKRRISLDKSKQ